MADVLIYRLSIVLDQVSIGRPEVSEERGDDRIEIDLLRRSEGGEPVADMSRLAAIVLPRLLAAYPDA
jgi:hypothetical protein